MSKEKQSVSGYLICFGIGILLGCLFLNLFWKWNSFIVHHERQFAMELLIEDTEYISFWKYSMGILGGLLYLFLISVGFTFHGTVFGKAVSFLLGVWLGAFLTEAVLVGGIVFGKEIVYQMMPDVPLYFTAILFCLLWQNNMSTGRTINRNGQDRKIHLKQWKNLLYSIFFFGLWMVSLIYVNQL